MFVLKTCLKNNICKFYSNTEYNNLLKTVVPWNISCNSKLGKNSAQFYLKTWNKTKYTHLISIRIVKTLWRNNLTCLEYQRFQKSQLSMGHCCPKTKSHQDLSLDSSVADLAHGDSDQRYPPDRCSLHFYAIFPTNHIKVTIRTI